MIVPIVSGWSRSGKNLMQPSSVSHKPPKNRFVRWLILCVFALTASLCFVASEASASCGDYLSHHGMILEDSNGSAPLLEKPGRCPCHGASCRQSPAQQPVPTPIVSLERQDRYVWTTGADVPAPSLSSSLALSDELVCVPMIAFRLDRPPKA